MTGLPKSMMLVGVARNCGELIHSSIESLRTAFGFVDHLYWLVIESDSDDLTVEKLKDIAAADWRFAYVSLGRLADRLPLRTERLAFCRNIYLDILKNELSHLEFSHIVVADLDGVNNLLTRRAVESCFLRNDWSAVFTNQLGPYYDIWALRHAAWSPNDCWTEYRLLIRCGVSRPVALQKSVYSRMITIPPDSEWISVNSAFGGLGIYKRDSLLRCRYRGLDQENMEICEHVSVNMDLSAEGGLYINPAFINSGVNSHSAPALGAVIFNKGRS